MGVVPAIVVYLMLWWMAFFLVLPIGVRSPEEAGERAVQGADTGAPVQARIGIKMLWATGLSACFWVLAYALIRMDVFGLAGTTGFGT